jgi:type IV pilus assembly protein PilB
MSTTPPNPNDKNQPPKKPAQNPAASNSGSNPSAGQNPAPKPTQPAPGQSGQQPKPPAPKAGATPAKPGTPSAKPPAAGAGKPAAGKPGATPAKKPAPKPKHAHVDASTKQLGQKFIDLGFIDDAQLESMYEEMRTTDRRLAEIAAERKLVNEDQLLQATAEVHGMRVANLEEVKPHPDAIKVVPKNMAELYKIVPLTYDSGTLTVALSDPNNLQAMDDLKNMLGIPTVNPVLAPPKQIDMLLTKAYSGEKEESITGLIAQLEASDIGSNSMGRENSIDLDDVVEMANSAPVRKLINMVLLMAIRDHSSDVHFEPFEDEYKMRYRCDGVLYEMVPPPRHLATAIASRIKVMSNLDIAERRLPQDGRIELNVGGNPVDMRVSVLPTLFGESVVIRVLDRTNVGLSLDRVGMPPDILAMFRQIIKKPNGIVLVTGPTGAGKTTTLYSALS